MKKAILAMCLTLALTSCSKNDDGGQSPTSTNNKKLVGLEFIDSGWGTPSGIVSATINYSGNHPVSVTTNVNLNVSIDYTNNKISKVTLMNSAGIVSSYYDVNYGVNGLIAKSDYYERNNGTLQLRWSYHYTYTNNVLTRKDEYELIGNTPVLVSYYLYENGNNGNILSMIEYDPSGNFAPEKYVYTDDNTPNKMADYPILQILGVWMEGDAWMFPYAFCHLENQYLSKYCITQEVRYDEDGNIEYQTDYQFVKDSDGTVKQKSDSYGNVIKFTYQ